MGCFNVSCGVSRISMGGGTPCVLIPLVPVDEKNTERYEGSFIVSNDGPLATFIPFALPIFGEYDDYGTMENIEEDCNTKAIEKFFGCKIEDFVNRCCRPFDDEEVGNDKLPKQTLGMFVHREVYDWLSTNCQSEYKKATTSYDSSDMSAFLLEQLGFIEGEKNDKRQRYNRPFTHSEFPTLVLWSDGTWVEAEINGKTCKYTGIYNPEDLDQFLEKNKLPKLSTTAALKERATYDIQYDKELAEVTKRKKMAESLVAELRKTGVRSEEEIQKYANSIRMMNNGWIFRLGTRFTEPDYFDEMYSHLFKNKTFKKLVVLFKTFQHGLWSVNALYQPSWCGLQCGNHNATRNLAELVQNITSKKLKEYADEEAEDEAEEAATK